MQEPPHASPAHWLDDDLESSDRARSPRVRPLLLVAAVVPWGIVLALMFVRTPIPAPHGGVAPVSTDDSGTDAAPATRPADGDGPSAETGVEGAPMPPVVEQAPASVGAVQDAQTDGSLSIYAGGGRVVPDLGDAAALAMVAARGWLSGLSPSPDGLDLTASMPPGSEGWYVEQLAVEGVDHPSAGHAVVSLLAVVLEVSDDGNDSARVVRVAVPVRFDADGAAIAGVPWLLSAPDLSVIEPGGADVLEPELLAEAGAALAAAGYEDIEVRGLRRTDGWPWIVEAIAIGPGVATPQQHHVWLRSHLGRFVVAGALPPPATPMGAIGTAPRDAADSLSPTPDAPSTPEEPR